MQDILIEDFKGDLQPPLMIYKILLPSTICSSQLSLK
jgi:hypothetical protein